MTKREKEKALKAKRDAYNYKRRYARAEKAGRIIYVNSQGKSIKDGATGEIDNPFNSVTEAYASKAKKTRGMKIIHISSGKYLEGPIRVLRQQPKTLTSPRRVK